MSSIISDIFYGSKRSLLDQYLHRQQQPSLASQKQWMLADQLSISIPKSPINVSDNINEQSSIKKASKNEQLYNININIHTIQKNKQLSKLYEVSLQMGRKTNRQLINIRNNNESDSNQAISLQQCTISQIEEHSSLKLQILLKENYESTYSKVKKAYGFIPIEVIKECLSAIKLKQTITKQMQLTLKGNLQFNKIKIEVYVTYFQSSQLQINQNSANQKSESYSQSPYNTILQPKRERYYLKGAPKRRFYHNKSSSKSKQRASYSNKTELQMIKQINKQSSNRKTPNKISSTRKQIINTHKIEKAIFYIIGIEQVNKSQTSQWSVQIVGDEKNYQINQMVQTYFSKQGVQLIVVDKSNEQIKLGICYLNPLVLLNMSSRHFQAEFPVCDENHICKGLLRISNSKINQPQIHKKQQLQHSISSQHPKQTMNSHNNIIIAIQFCKILIYFPSQQQKRINSTLNLIVHSKYQLQNHEIALKKLEHRNLFQITLKNQSNMIIVKSQQNSQWQDNIELQIMENNALISYSKLTFNFNKPQTGIQWFCGYLDGGMKQQSSVLCSMLIKGTILKYESNYFQSIKIDKILELVTQTIYLQKLLELKNKSGIQFQQCLYTLISTYNSHNKNKITFVECQRLANMIKQIVKYPQMEFFLQCSKDLTRSDYNSIANNQQIEQQLKYLDQELDGFVDFQIWKQIAKYYGINTGQQWSFNYKAVHGFIDEVLNQKLSKYKQTNVILPYLFLLSGLTLSKPLQKQIQTQKYEMQNQHQNHQQSQIQNKQNQQEKISIDANDQRLSQPKDENKFNHQNIRTHQSSIYIEQIQCKNFHLLMPNRKVPSCMISLCPSRVQYSNANPIFKIHNYVENGTTIKFTNKNIRNPKQQHILTTIVLDRHRSKYTIQKQIQIFIRFNSQKRIQAKTQ